MIVRVATLNNFNCSAQEFTQLEKFTKVHLDKRFFVNSNIKSLNPASIVRLNNNNYPVVVTANPDILLHSPIQFIRNTLLKIRNLAFIRVRYIPLRNEIEDLVKHVKDLAPIVYTLMRFKRHATFFKYMDKFTMDKFYYHKTPYKHLKKEFYPAIDHETTFICNEKGLGCPGCNLCTKLTYNMEDSISSLNLEASGFCKWHCPECFVKLGRTQGKVIAFNKLTVNSKMKGK